MADKTADRSGTSPLCVLGALALLRIQLCFAISAQRSVKFQVSLPGCPKHATWPGTRAAFWLAKITGNRTRDRRVNSALRGRGWIVIRVWDEARQGVDGHAARRGPAGVIVPGARTGRPDHNTN
jgi:hypothetical protein